MGFYSLSLGYDTYLKVLNSCLMDTSQTWSYDSKVFCPKNWTGHIRMRVEILHPQKQELTQLYIFISVSFEVSLYSWITAWDDDIQWGELFPSESVESDELFNLEFQSKFTFNLDLHF